MFDIFKPLGLLYPELNDDRYLTKMIQFGSIFNALSFVWTFFMDFKAITFKHLFGILLALEVFCCFTIFLLVKTRATYAFTIIVANFCMSGLFGMIPNVVFSVFGKAIASQLYGLIYMGQIITVVST